MSNNNELLNKPLNNDCSLEDFRTMTKELKEYVWEYTSFINFKFDEVKERKIIERYNELLAYCLAKCESESDAVKKHEWVVEYLMERDFIDRFNYKKEEAIKHKAKDDKRHEEERNENKEKSINELRKIKNKLLPSPFSIQNDEKGHKIGEKVNVTQQINQTIESLISKDINLLPDYIGETKMISNSDYIDNSKNISPVDSRTIESPLDIISKFYGVVSDNNYFTKDNLWADRVRLFSLRRFLLRSKEGADIIDRIKPKDFEDLLKGFVEDQDMSRHSFTDEHRIKINSLALGLRFKQNPYNIDHALAWVNSAINKLIQYEIDMDNVFSSFARIYTGSQGEKTISTLLDSYKYKCLRNHNLSYNNNKFECDALWIRPEGIFILENKNYHGVVRIDENENFVKRNFEGEELDLDVSPIVQNKRQVDLLKGLLCEKCNLSDEFVQGLVVLSNANVSLINESKYPVLEMPFVDSYIKRNYQTVLSEGDLDRIYDILVSIKEKEPLFEATMLKVKKDPFDLFNKEIDHILNLVALNGVVYESRFDVSKTYYYREKVRSANMIVCKPHENDYIKTQIGVINDVKNIRNEPELKRLPAYLFHYYDDWYSLSLPKGFEKSTFFEK